MDEMLEKNFKTMEQSILKSHAQIMYWQEVVEFPREIADIMKGLGQKLQECRETLDHAQKRMRDIEEKRNV